MRIPLILLILSLNCIGAAIAAKPDPAPDDSAIRATITDYIEGYYLSDPARMERSLHPHFLKHTISGSSGELNIVDKSGMEMVQEVRNKKEVTPVSERRKEISIFAIDGDVASAKLIASQWTNYVTLLKLNGEWKILSVVKRNQW
jgi:putative lumazine-binding protein